MAEFENINSPPEGLTLEKEVQLAVTQAVERLLHSNSWRTYTGPHQEQLKQELSQVVGASHVGLTCSGSVALEHLLRACRLRPGDEVLLAGYDYPGNFTAIENCGARPALVDLAADSWNLSPESLDAAWTPACKVLIVSHLHGQLQDMPRWQSWCRERQVVLIQDACQSIGATIEGQSLSHWSDATILSFGGTKLLSAGRGGAWCTSDESLAQHARLAAGVGSGAYDLSELQAAMIVAQLPYLPRITQCCRNYFAAYAQRLTSEGCIVPWIDQLSETAFYQAGWLLPKSSADRAQHTDFNHTETLASPGIEREVFGKGFEGFHRRSNRRCRIACPLDNVIDVVARTVVIHHRSALRTM